MFPVFYFIPVRDSFKDVHYQAVTLRAPPTLARFLFILEIIFTLIIFALSYYYSATTSTTETTISFEILASPYTCAILSPRSDSYTFGTDNSELVQFSDARLTYSACMTYLGSSGYDLCNQNRDDYLLKIIGIGNDDSSDYSCVDILLSDGYRLCYGSQEEYSVENSLVAASFVTQDYTTTATYSKVYYFMNSSSNIHALTNTIDRSDVYTDYVTDLQHNAYVVAKGSSNSKVSLYQLNPLLSTTTSLMDMTTSSICGMTYGDSTLFIYTIEQTMYRIIAYNTTKHTATTTAFTCPTTTSTTQTGYGTRYVSFGTDRNLYIICNSNTMSANSQMFQFVRMNPYTLTTTTLSANIASFNYTSSSGNVSSNKINQVVQVLYVGDKFYFLADGYYKNILRGNIVGASTTVAGLSIVGVYDGSYGVVQSSTKIYFPEGNYSYYDITTSSVSKYSASSFRPSYYHTIAIEHAYRYQICNTNLSSYTIDGSTSASFRRKCWQKNGFYYQNNDYFEVPTSCVGAISSKTDATSLLSCAAVASQKFDYINSTCTASYAKVCDQEYNENPPFSCTQDTYPTTLTNLSTAFANASAAFSFLVIFFRIMCKILYPHGCTEYDYDVETERYLPAGALKNKPTSNKIHAATSDAVPATEQDAHFISPRDISPATNAEERL